MKMIGHDHFICHSYCHFSVLSHILLFRTDIPPKITICTHYISGGLFIFFYRNSSC